MVAHVTVKAAISSSNRALSRRRQALSGILKTLHFLLLIFKFKKSTLKIYNLTIAMSNYHPLQLCQYPWCSFDKNWTRVSLVGLRWRDENPPGANSAYLWMFSKGWDFFPVSAGGLPVPRLRWPECKVLYIFLKNQPPGPSELRRKCQTPELFRASWAELPVLHSS